MTPREMEKKAAELAEGHHPDCYTHGPSKLDCDCRLRERTAANLAALHDVDAAAEKRGKEYVYACVTGPCCRVAELCLRCSNETVSAARREGERIGIGRSKKNMTDIYLKGRREGTESMREALHRAELIDMMLEVLERAGSGSRGYAGAKAALTGEDAT